VKGGLYAMKSKPLLYRVPLMYLFTIRRVDISASSMAICNGIVKVMEM